MATHISKEKRAREKQKQHFRDKKKPGAVRTKHIAATTTELHVVTMEPEREGSMNVTEFERRERRPLSNLKYARGSIIYAEFSRTGEFAIHNKRPLVVIGMPIGIYGKLICCTTTSQNTPGIVAHLYRDNGLPIGGYPVTTIVPYNLVPVEVSQVINTIGQLNPWIFEEVDNAVAFHLGYSNKIPGYCAPGTGFYDDHLAVKYTYGRQYYDPDELYVEEEEDTGESMSPDPMEEMEDSVEEPMEDLIEETPQEVEMKPSNDIPIIPVKRRRVRHEENSIYNLLNVITKDERYDLMIGLTSGAEMAKRLDIDVSKVSRLRKAVIADAIDESSVSRIKSLLNGSVTNFSLLSNIDKAAVTYYLPETLLDIRPKEARILERRVLLYMHSSGARMRTDRAHPDSIYMRLARSN